MSYMDIPDDMVRVARMAMGTYRGATYVVEAVLRWQNEYPPTFTDQQIDEMFARIAGPDASAEKDSIDRQRIRAWAVELFRNAYLLHNDLDGPLQDLLVNPVVGMINGAQVNDRIRRAYFLGRESKK